jgi:DNA-binding transcriptional LysR family regulator
VPIAPAAPGASGAHAPQGAAAAHGPRIDPVSLRLFVAVMDLGTIAAAAEREHIVPSAVSRRLADLEYSLKTRLLDRSNKGIEPTAAGLELLGLARSVLNDLDNVYHLVREHASGARGIVRVFANLSAITEFLPLSLRGFMSTYPLVQVQLQERISTAVQQGVACNAAEVGLYVHGSNSLEGLVSLPYRRDELVVVVPDDHPLAAKSEVRLAQTLEHDFVGLHTGSQINQQVLRAAEKLGHTVRSRMQVTSYDALSLMVEAGMGIALMPRLVGQRYSRIHKLRVLTLLEPWAEREIRICVRSIESLSPAARLFVEHIRSEALH